MAFNFDERHPQAEAIAVPSIDELKECSFRLPYCRTRSVSDGVDHEWIAMKLMYKKLVSKRRRP
ncbi:hypothetical protein SS05631_a46640 (plasmid) [Sinorhizobium sp. CCBAU 05631]|nr:hypothetical protein SS05631_a46640 [Sinorhizobium sp. CCBAU 05631]